MGVCVQRTGTVTVDNNHPRVAHVFQSYQWTSFEVKVHRSVGSEGRVNHRAFDLVQQLPGKDQVSVAHCFAQPVSASVSRLFLLQLLLFSCRHDA